MSRQLSTRTSSRVAWSCRKQHLCLVILVVCLLCPVSCQDHRLATFYGAYQRIKPSLSDTGLAIVINFKTATEDGLLFAARLDHEGSNAGYLAVGIDSQHLVTQTLQSVHVTTGSVVERGEWYELSVVMIGVDISVDLRRDGVILSSSNLTLSSLLTVRDVFLGGANSFFSRVYVTLDVTEYFTGCLANSSFNGRDIDFVPRGAEYGIEDSCCPNPEPIMWQFVSGHRNSFVFNSRLAHARFQTDTLMVSFSIQPENDGMVFYSHDESIDFALAMEIVNGQLVVYLANEHDHFQAHVLTCEGFITDGWRHKVVVTLHEDVLECLVDGSRSWLNASRPTLPPDAIEYHIGSAEVSTSNSNLLLFQSNLQTIPDHNMFPSFGGTLQKFQLNGLDISPPSLSTNSPSLSSACPQMDLLPVCQQLHEQFSLPQITRISVSATTVNLNENDLTILTDEQIVIDLPDYITGLDVQEAIWGTVQFELVVPPNYGSLINASNLHQHVTEFTYSHVVNGSLAYQHNGEEFASDSMQLNVTFTCSQAIPESLTVNFDIRLTNDFPVITQQSTLYIAVGTRRTISANILTVTDEESTNPINISFRVVSILVDGCSNCGAAGRIERSNSPGFNTTYFNQKEIYSGDVMFQHFIQYGTRPITIHLRVSDMVVSSIEVALHVEPYVGNVTLTRNEPLFMVEGRCGYISTEHLNATTDFGNQNPILQYSVTSAPEYGRLEIQDQGYWRPVLGPNIAFEGFTQQSIDRGFVRYCHDNSSLATDVFEFRLHSAQLEGGRGNFSVNVFAYADLAEPTVSLTTSPLTLAEGEDVTLLPATLDVSLSRNVRPPWSRERILIGDFGIFFHLQQLPQFGQIFLNGQTLSETTPGFSLDDLIGGGITYRHDNSENHEDFVSIRVEARNSPNLPVQSPRLPPVSNLTLSITPVNDHTPEIATRHITLSEGHFVTMTPAVLNITDKDLPPQTVMVTVLDFDPEYGFFAGNTATPVMSFSTVDVQAGRVYYHHQFNISLPLSHTVRIKASDGYTATEQDIEITARPLTIDTRLVPTEECIADLDAIEPILSVPVSHVPFLFIEIRDEHGIDPNRLESISLRVTQYPVHGQLLLGNQIATTFTMNDLRDDLVKYNFLNRTNIVNNDTVRIEVSYGHSTPVTVTLKVCIDHVPTPKERVLKPISLATETSVLIDNSTLRAEDSRGNSGEAITYCIIHPPQWGRVVDVANNTLRNFTQADIDAHRVLYQHINRSSSSLNDYFVFQLCTEYVCMGEYSVTVTFFVTNLTVHNFGLTVNEGGWGYIMKDHLYAVAPEDGVRIHVTVPPIQGELILNAGGIIYRNPAFFSPKDIASRSVWYNHSGSESVNDTFIFNVTAPNSKPIPGVFFITVTPVNDNEPFLSKKFFSMIARTTRNITSDDLFAYDSDSDVNSSNLVYRVANGPFHGVIHRRNDSSRTPLSEWYERDVRAGRLAYTHTGQDILQKAIIDVLSIQLYDRDQFKPQLIRIYIDEIQLTVQKRVLTVDEGGEGTVDGVHLHAESVGDESVTNSHLNFNLTSFPKHGNLTLRGQPVNNFTQDDLSTPGLVYQHDHSNTISDKFNYTVTIVQHDATENGTFEIAINPIDDDAPVLLFRRKPLFVVEGEGILIISDYIEVIDIDTDMNLATQTDQIKFQIIAEPRHGAIKRRQGAASNRFRTTEVFTLYEVNHNSVRFESHHIDERSDSMWFDSFLVNLTDGDNTHDTPYNFTFVILPDVVSVQRRSFSVPEGDSVVLPNDTITARHPYLSTHTLGTIVIRESPSNGSLVNIATGEVNISNFTTADLANGNIEYRHNDAEKEKDKITFMYIAHQPVSSDTVTQPGKFPDVDVFRRTSDIVSLDIDVKTVNDRGPEIRTGPNNTLVMWAEDCAFLSTRHLDVFDADTPNSKLVYTFNFTFDAYISHINDSNNIPVSSFTQEDVVNSLIKLFHHSGEMGIMYYRVTDGEYTAYSQLNIETDRLKIVILNNNPLSVPINGMVRITPDDLKVGRSDVNATIQRCQFDETVEYQFYTKYGVIVVDGLSNATSFTDDDVKKGRVYYQHTKPELWEPLETLKLKAKTALTKVKEFNLNITIELPSEPNSPLAVHKPLVVQEGGRACLDEEILDARNIRYSAVKETYNNTLTSWFEFHYSANSHGEILVNGKNPPWNPPSVTQAQIASGSVCYHNYGDESPEDPLEFSVCIKDSGGFRRSYETDLILNISVVLINDEVPIVTSSTLLMSVVEGFSATIGNDSLQISDEDNPPSDLVFTMLGVPAGGRVLFGEQELQQNDNFTQAMVDEGLLKFEALKIGTWTVQLSFTDGEFENQTDFVVEVKELFIKVERTEVLRYSQNKNGTHLTPKHIITRTNGNHNETVYYVAEYPKNGVLKGLNGESFNQTDLNSLNVSYVPTNFDSHSDSFKLYVGNRDAENQTATVEIQVDIWGQVRQDAELDFDSKDGLSLPLPKNILRLSNLQLFMQRPPKIEITQQPKLGFLEVKFDTDPRSRRSVTQNRGDVTFTYDYLDSNWVYYTWNSSNMTLDNPQKGVNETFSILVEGFDGIQPGRATITLCIKNPPIVDDHSPTTEEPSLSETTSSPTPFQEEESSSGFPTYALLPILGVFVSLLVIIVVVIVICVTQQGRIRKRWQPRMPRQHWTTRGQNFSLQPSSYDLDPYPQVEAMTSLTDVVDRGNEYQEIRSPISRQSPRSRYSPMASRRPSGPFPSSEGQSYHRHVIPRPRSRRSNVSVSYSRRPLSEVTLDDVPRSRLHDFSNPLMSGFTTLVPNGRGTQCSSEYEGGEGESGYLSTPNPSIAAVDEPVRLVLRRPAVEEVLPLPRAVGEGSGGNDGEEVEEEGGMEEEAAAMENSEERGQELSVDERVKPQEEADQSLEQQHPELFATDSREPLSHNEEDSTPRQSDRVPMHTHSNSAHAVSSTPDVSSSMPGGPIDSDTRSSSAQQYSSSDLHTLFRTHNPILKHTEYWV